MRLVLIILLFLTSCSNTEKSFRKSDRETIRLLNSKKAKPIFHSYRIENKVVYNFIPYDKNIFTYGIGNRKQKFKEYAGMYTRNNDTFYLDFFRHIQPDGNPDKAYSDKAEQNLIIVANDTSKTKRLAINPTGSPLDKNKRVVFDIK